MSSADNVIAWLRGRDPETWPEAEWSPLSEPEALDPACPGPVRTTAEVSVHRRKDVRCLTSGERSALLRALVALEASGEWGTFVDRHNPANDFAHGTLSRPLRTPDQTENALQRFLPWHRMFLLEFEQALRRHVAGVTLPYWNWSSHRGIPSILSDPAMPRTIRNSVEFGSGTVVRNPGGNPGFPTLPTAAEVNAALSNTTFRPLTLALERLHNTVHMWGGGRLPSGEDGTLSLIRISPADFAFFLHHAEIDRLWSVWANIAIGERARVAGNNRPVVTSVPEVAGAASGEELPGLVIRKRDGSAYRFVDTLRAANLGYGYDRYCDTLPASCTGS
jgi:tyrosinase